MNCPNCGLELPGAIYDAHVSGCTDYLDTLGTADEQEGTGGEAVLDVDSQFEQLMSGLDFTEPAPADAVNVCLLDDLELSKRFNATRDELMQRGEMLKPTSQYGRDLHSWRAAYIIEMRRRGMM